MTAAATFLPPHTLPNLQQILPLVQILLAYGRHLAETFDRRASAPGFHLIARAFGTARPAVILAHIRRGILRAAALERLLLRRAARGRDLTIPPLRIRIRRADAPPTPAPAPHTTPAPTLPAQTPAPLPRQRPAPRPSWRDDRLDTAADPLDPALLPTPETLRREMRRRPIGRILGDIYADLGIAPVLCLSAFWDQLFFAMLNFDGSPATYDLRRWRREQAFDREQDRRPTLDQSWPPVEPGPARGHIPKGLGFFIGEAPAEPPPPPPTPPAAPRAPAPQSPWVTALLRRPAPAATGPP